jgi:PAS domain S-box-containing protein
MSAVPSNDSGSVRNSSGSDRPEDPKPNSKSLFSHKASASRGDVGSSASLASGNSVGDHSLQSIHSSTLDSFSESSPHISSVDGSKSGMLKKKSWNLSKEVFVQIENGVLFEFKNKKTRKPSRVMTLSHYAVRLADDLSGTTHSFGLFSKKKNPTIYSCENEAQLISWVTVCSKYCSKAEVEWKQDEMLEAFNDAVIMSSDVGVILGVNESALSLFGYTRSELVGKSVKIFMPESIAKQHDRFMSNYLQTNEKRLIGKPRKFTALSKEGEELCVELSLGEIVIGSERKYIAQFRSFGKRFQTSDDDSSYNIAQSVSESMDQILTKYTEDVKKVVTEEVDRLLRIQLQKAEEEILHLKETIEDMEKEKVVAAQAAASSPPPSSSSSSSSSSSITSVDDVMRHLRKDQRIISLRNVEVNEKIGGDGGSGTTVYVCTVDGWQCAVKVLSLEGLSSQQTASFESEGLSMSLSSSFSHLDFFLSPPPPPVNLLESLSPHRNLVRYLFHERSKTTMRLFMKRYQNTLRGHMMERAAVELPFTYKEAISIGLDISVGLDFLHKNKIIHRDMKTDNIFVTLDGLRTLQCCSIGDMDSAKRLIEGIKATTVLPLRYFELRIRSVWKLFSFKS